jgi:hypothetical protein
VVQLQRRMGIPSGAGGVVRNGVWGVGLWHNGIAAVWAKGRMWAGGGEGTGAGRGVKGLGMYQRGSGL